VLGVGGSLFLQDDPRRVNVPVKLTGRAFDLGPDGGEGAVGEFGEGGVADEPATDFRGAIGEECGLAPGQAFVARGAKVQRKAQRRGAGIAVGGLFVGFSTEGMNIDWEGGADDCVGLRYTPPA